MTEEATAPKRQMPKGGRLSRAERHARKVADAYRTFEESLPAMLEKVTKRILSDDTPPGVFVQALGTLDKMLALMPKPEIATEADHLDAARVARAMNVVRSNPERYVVVPIELEKVRSEHDRYERELAALDAKIAEVRARRQVYHDEVERRPLGVPSTLESAEPAEAPGLTLPAPESKPAPSPSATPHPEPRGNDGVGPKMFTGDLPRERF